MPDYSIVFICTDKAGSIWREQARIRLDSPPKIGESHQYALYTKTIESVKLISGDIKVPIDINNN